MRWDERPEVVLGVLPIPQDRGPPLGAHHDADELADAGGTPRLDSALGRTQDSSSSRARSALSRPSHDSIGIASRAPFTFSRSRCSRSTLAAVEKTIPFARAASAAALPLALELHARLLRDSGDLAHALQFHVEVNAEQDGAEETIAWSEKCQFSADMK